MAQKVDVHLEDDLDGGPVEETLTFALDGKDYEVSHSESNAEKLREALRPYVAAARKAPVGTGGRRKRATGTSTSSGRPPRSGFGPISTATNSATAVAFTRPSATPTAPPTDPGHRQTVTPGSSAPHYWVRSGGVRQCQVPSR
ncbi:Lsr2 family protein [Kocuria rosea]|uniref:Lsr2 family protein n=1 Tax=Kocuria rosea TaxID=1275 RepID=UPI0027E2D954|nr:Lsr2 family protein [Kocuria rosea]